MADVQSLSLRRGANAFKALVDKIGTISCETCGSWADYEAGGAPPPDERDYASMLALVETSLREHLDHSDAMRRQGFLRAMTDLLCMSADSSVPDFSEWDPIRNTARSFDARGSAAQ